MRYYILLFLMVLSINSSFALSLVEQGKSNYSIVIAKDAIASEEKAATEFQKYIFEITSVKLPIIAEKESEQIKNRIYFGQSEKIANLLDEKDLAQLSSDTIIIKSVGDDLIFSGARPRGTLYAAYTFLEDYCGVRFWTSRDSYIPKKKDIQLSDIALKYTPPFYCREPYFSDCNYNPEFAVKLKINGGRPNITKEFGGNLPVLGFVHTFDKLIPAKEYLATHPEYFSLRNGSRHAGVMKGQLCLTNPDVKLLLLGKSQEWLKKSPDSEYISISQNDNRIFCECENCKKSYKKYGYSGTLLNVINFIAEELQKDYPKIKVVTLAYQNTISAPLGGVKPNDNVVIQLCSLECSFSVPLDHSQNRAFYNALVSWSKITKELFVWDYVTDFRNYLKHYPNFQVLSKNIHIFREHNVKRLLEQSSYEKDFQKIPNFAALKLWLLAKLCWNPELNQDELTKEFCEGYYGNASTNVLNILDIMKNNIEKSNYFMSCFNSNAAKWLDIESMLQIDKELELARKAVAEESDILERLEFLQLSQYMSWFDYFYPVEKGFIEMPNGVSKPNFSEKLEKIQELAKKYNIKQFAETKTNLATWAKSKQKEIENVNNIPAEFKSFDAKNIFTFTPSQMALTSHAKIVEEDNAPAVKLMSSSVNWDCQLHINTIMGLNQAKWHAYVYIKTNKKTAKDIITVGSYDVSTKRNIQKRYNGDKLFSEDYIMLDLGTHELNDRGYFVVAPVGNTEGGDIFIKQFVLIQEKI